MTINRANTPAFSVASKTRS